MRLLMISVDALPRLGGISLMAHYLANALADEGVSVEFLGPLGTHCPTGFPARYAVIEDFESRTKARGGGAAVQEDERIERLLSLIVADRRCDRILLMHPNYYGPAATDLAARFGIPVSCFSHGYEVRSQTIPRDDTDLTALAADADRRDPGERLLRVLGRADERLANSTYTADLLRSLNAPPPVRVVGCGIARDVIEREVAASEPGDPPARADRRAALGLGAMPMIVSCGRLVPHKRVDRLIDMVAASDELQAVVIGDGPERLALEEHARATGAADRVTFAGQVEEDEKWRLHRASDFAALLSETNDEQGQVEGFGIALLEGAIAGAVPVSSGTGGMVDVVKDGETGLILPPDASAAAAAARLSEVASRPDAMNALAERARDQVLHTYNYERIARDLTNGWRTA